MNKNLESRIEKLERQTDPEPFVIKVHHKLIQDDLSTIDGSTHVYIINPERMNKWKY